MFCEAAHLVGVPYLLYDYISIPTGCEGFSSLLAARPGSIAVSDAPVLRCWGVVRGVLALRVCVVCAPLFVVNRAPSILYLYFMM